MGFSIVVRILGENAESLAWSEIAVENSTTPLEREKAPGEPGPLGWHWKAHYQISFAPNWICREPPEPTTGLEAPTSGVVCATARSLVP